MENSWTECQRNFNRYQVAELDHLRGKIEQVQGEFQLLTIGGGGCGFIGNAISLAFEPPKRVFLSFQWCEDSPLKIEGQGNLKYASAITFKGRNLKFYGIEFLEAHRKLIQPIIEKLQSLQEKGQIRMSV